MKISLFGDRDFLELQQAIRSGDIEAVEASITRGSSVSGRRAVQKAKRHKTEIPVIVALEANERKQMLSLLSKIGADLDQVGVAGFSPLSIAAQRGDMGALEILTDLGASVKPRMKKETSALALAAFYGHERAVSFLLSKGANPNDVLSGSTNSLMRIPGRILRLLVQAGGEVPKSIKEMLDGGHALGDLPRPQRSRNSAANLRAQSLAQRVPSTPSADDDLK